MSVDENLAAIRDFLEWREQNEPTAQLSESVIGYTVHLLAQQYQEDPTPELGAALAAAVLGGEHVA